MLNSTIGMAGTDRHPMKLSLGWKTYSIQLRVLDDAFGEVDFHKNTIYLNPNQSDVDYRETLLHEIIHVLYFMNGLSQECEKLSLTDELLTTLTSQNLFNFMFNNKKLFHFILYGNQDYPKNAGKGDLLHE